MRKKAMELDVLHGRAHFVGLHYLLLVVDRANDSWRATTVCHCQCVCRDDVILVGPHRLTLRVTSLSMFTVSYP